MSHAVLKSALAVFAIDPAAIGGLWLRARASPQRQAFLDCLAACSPPLPITRLAPNISDDALFGGLDAAATLSIERPVFRSGLLDRDAILVLPMAERCDPGLAARLAQILDNKRHSIIALDEAAEEGEGVPPALIDRLGLFVNLDGLRFKSILEPIEINGIVAARALLPKVRVPHMLVTEVVRACAELAIISARAPILTLTAARALAALSGRTMVERDDLTQASALTLAQRAAPFDEPTQSSPPPEEDGTEPEDASTQSDSLETKLPSEIMVEAARAALPPEILKLLVDARSLRNTVGASGSGVSVIGNRRGRPLAPRRGKPQSHQKLDLIATLRAAAPWQKLRRKFAQTDAQHDRLFIESSDFHVKRNKVHSDRVLVFAVDASGSAAVARLSEAKGAVEQLLARAYSRRDHVALLSFRGAQAELLLPPTRSLVLAKNRLRSLPGGGGTPLADGLKTALETALRARSKGMTPTIAILTDGKGNVALDGSGNRALAEQQTHTLARAIRATGIATLIIDVARRPHAQLTHLTQLMGARYVALSQANAKHLSAVLGATLEG